MLTQTDYERERYESRRKAQLDYQTGINAARREGLQEGLQKGLARGEVIGVIHLCERMLGRPETPAAMLASLPPDEAARLAAELQEQIVKRK